MRYLDIIRHFEAATKHQEDQQRPFPQILPSWQISWIGGDGKLQGPAAVDSMAMDLDGTVWVFVTLADGWAAVNANYVTWVRTVKET